MGKEKRSKNQIRRDKAKQKKLKDTDDSSIVKHSTVESSTLKQAVSEPSIEQEQKPINEPLIGKEQNPTKKSKTEDSKVKDTQTLDENNELYSQFANIFNRFQGTPDQNDEGEDEEKEEKIDKLSNNEVFFNDGDIASEEDISSSDDEESTGEKELSRRQYRKIHKIPLSALRSSTSNPQIVEWYDADAPDPYLLVKIKSQPNIIQVPDHWSSKREYLASRKGIERLPFELPKFIQGTGIQEMRGAGDELSLKEQQRARVQPKMGKLDIDYQKLHDAFFKYQTKPRLLGFGDIYYEGRETTDEFSEEVSSIKPGRISSALRSALGMDANDDAVPPPWISIMQEIGKPPAYEHLYIPGIDFDYDNSGYTVADRVETQRDEVNVDDFWGKPIEGEESSEEEGDDDDEEENDEEDDNKSEDNGSDNEEDDPEAEGENATRVEINEFSRGKGGIQSKETSKPHQQSSGGKLYTVLKENKDGSKGELKYDLSGEDKDKISDADNGISEEEESEEDSSIQTKNFKF